MDRGIFHGSFGDVLDDLGWVGIVEIEAEGTLHNHAIFGLWITVYLNCVHVCCCYCALFAGTKLTTSLKANSSSDKIIGRVI